jgi:hypothetical protein
MVRLADWITGNGISRSTAYELMKLLHLRPHLLRVTGHRKPISHLDMVQQCRLAPLVEQFKSGSSVAQIRECFPAARLVEWEIDQ